MKNMRHVNVRRSSVLAALAACGLLASCFYEDDGCKDYGECAGGAAGSSGSSGKGGTSSGGISGSGGSADGGVSGDGGIGGAGGDGGTGGGVCDATKNPGDEPCLVSDEYAVFVAPSGDDEDAGTMSAPVATLTKAVELAAGDKLVLVCNDTYDEHVVITEAARVFGGFSCSTWNVEAGAPLFKPTDAGPALTVDSVQEEVFINRVDFEVPDAEGSGTSAVTAIVNASPNVLLRGVTLTAGMGQPGNDGTLTEFSYAAQSTLNGNPEEPVTMGGAAKICECQSGLETSGGVGGSPSPSGQDGGDGSPDHGNGVGGDASAADCGGGSSGKAGADAPDRPAASGATSLGAASLDGWAPTSGTNGATGEPGQGGGGGASLNSSGHGGGGGCGGCGGNGGKGGQGGGGSIALLLIDSPVALQSCTLVTDDAGDGGDGHIGQVGQQQVGSGGSVIDNQNSCPGGVGGDGGDGGAGGGGAGGVSVGIVWQGDTAPTVSEDTMISVGDAGLPGEGGAGTNDGIDGVAQEVLEL